MLDRQVLEEPLWTDPHPTLEQSLEMVLAQADELSDVAEGRLASEIPLNELDCLFDALVVPGHGILPRLIPPETW